MIHMCGHCWWGAAGFIVGWWLVGSALLWLTWNRVMVVLFKLKTANYWQALLLIVTLTVLCAPKGMMHRHHQNCCHQSKACCHDGDGKDKDCPYAAKGSEHSDSEHRD